MWERKRDESKMLKLYGCRVVEGKLWRDFCALSYVCGKRFMSLEMKYILCYLMVKCGGCPQDTHQYVFCRNEKINVVNVG